jgi:hypothetical protein
VAGGIYWCAEGQADRAQNLCMPQPFKIKTAESLKYARQQQDLGFIDPLENLNAHRFYIYASPNDWVVNPVNGDKLREFLTGAAPQAAVQMENSIASAHGFPTWNYGNLCLQVGIPWLLNCGFDAAGAILNRMYGALIAPAMAYPLAPYSRKPGEDRLYRFDQREFASRTTAPLFDYGWIYVPKRCAQGASCRLHVALHGCQMTPDFIDDQFARHAGYNEWAEANDIVVLYPQARKVESVNPYACWDWFGFTGADYATKKGPQMEALKLMIDRVSGTEQTTELQSGVPSPKDRPKSN